MESPATFSFRQFRVQHAQSMKVGTDSVLLGAWADVHAAARVLDVGTGCGVLALMVAQRTSPTTRITAIELDLHAAAEARENFQQSPWHERLSLVAADFLTWRTNEQFDLIISNPPYFENSLLPPAAARTAARHTVALHTWEILVFAKTHLTATGSVNVVLPTKEGELLIEKSRQLPMWLTRQCRVRSRAHKPVERLLLEFRLTPKDTESHELILHATDTARSAAYHALTDAFYTKG
jgi:tRNA1Val (adenine37-N6)-methyltransferase